MDMVFRENIVYKIFAIALAIFLWLYVTASGSSLNEKNFSLPIEYINLNEEFVLVEMIETVDIRVRGDEKLVNGLNEKDLKAIVDVGLVGIGETLLPITISKPINLEVIDLYPKQVKIEVDQLAEKQVPVSLALLGETAHGYSSFKATVKPSHILLRGPATILETIVSARAEVNLAMAETNLALNLPVKVQDQWGNFYNESIFTMSPSTVEVYVPIVSDTPSKTVPIRVTLTDSPAHNYRVVRTVVEPETVQVLGSQSSLDKIDLIQTKPISVHGLTENTVTEVELVTPSGVTLINEEKVKVIVQVEEVQKEKELEGQINIKNLAANYDLVLESPTVKINIEGPGNIIDKLTTDDLEVFIDVQGLGLGKHEVDIEYQKSAPVGVQTNPKKVIIEIRERDGSQKE